MHQYLTNTKAGLQILQGKYFPAPGLDPATVKFLKEAVRLAQLIRQGGSKSLPTVSKEEFQFYWSKISEYTSSSASKLHFGKYKFAAKDAQKSHW